MATVKSNGIELHLSNQEASALKALLGWMSKADYSEFLSHSPAHQDNVDEAVLKIEAIYDALEEAKV